MPLYDKPRPFRRRDKLGARDLNKLREAVPRQIRGGANISVEQHGDRIIVTKDNEPTKHEFQIAKLVVKQEFDDWVLCTPLYPDADNTELANLVHPDPPIHDSDLGANTEQFYVYVAKPRLLQRTPWDGQTLFVNGRNKTFNYYGNNSGDTWPPTNDHIPGRREVIYDGGETVVEVIDEAYFPGDIITAVFLATGYEDPFLDPDDFGEGERPHLFWQDINEGARRWVTVADTGPPIDPADCPCSTDTEFWLTSLDTITCDPNYPVAGANVSASPVAVCLRYYGSQCIWWSANEDDIESDSTGATWLWLLVIDTASDIGGIELYYQQGISSSLFAHYRSAAAVSCSGTTTFNLETDFTGGSCTLPSTLTLEANACEAPPTSGSGSEDCTGERTGLGTDSGKATNEVGVTGVTVAIGDTLIVTVGTKGSLSSVTVDIEGTNVPLRATDGFALGFNLRIFSLKMTAAVSGGTVTVTTNTNADVLLMAVDKLVGVDNTTGAPQNFISSNGTSTEPNAPMGGHEADACNFLLGLVLTNGPVGDTDGDWENNFSHGGQDVGTSGGADTDNLRLCQGTNFPPFDYSSTVKKTGITSRQWICMWLEWVMA